jgi:hypothetical protein
MRAASMLGRGFIGALIASAILLAATTASAIAEVRWKIDPISNTTAQPGDILSYRVQVKNSGTSSTDGSPYALTAELPPGFTIADPSGPVSDPENPHHVSFFGSSLNFKMFAVGVGVTPCTAIDGSPLLGGESEVKCEGTEGVGAKGFVIAFLSVDVDPAAVPGTVLTARFHLSGGGGASVSTVDPTTVSAAPPPFGIDAFDAYIRKADNTPYTRAGGHAAFASGTEIDFNTHLEVGSHAGPNFPVEPPKDTFVDVPPGLVGDTGAVGYCTAVELAGGGGTGRIGECPTDSQLGTVTLRNPGVLVLPDTDGPLPLYQMVPPPGVAARFGFNYLGTVVSIDALMRSEPTPRLVIGSRNISEGLALSGVQVELWGVPYDPVHDPDRGCPGLRAPSQGEAPCPISVSTIKPFLRLPTSCTAPGEGLPWKVRTASWYEQGGLDEEGFPIEADSAWKTRSVVSHQAPGYPHLPSEWGAPVGITGCADVPVKGNIDVQPTTLDAESSSGLEVNVEVPNPGIESPSGISSSDLKEVKLSLPQGMTINPSQAEGLGTCSAAAYASTELSFYPTDRGCPQDSKIGTVEVVTPLLEERIPGEVFIAQPDDPSTTAPGAENPFDSLLAIYVILEEPQRGILVKLPGLVRTDESTGRIVTTFKDLPQLPFSTFDFKFREGARAPLITPPNCGTYTTEAEITGWSAPNNPILTKSSFEVQRGIGAGPCPPGGVPPFKPGFSAGSINNNAKSFTPFVMRLTRQDGEQNMTKFSSVLPPGVLGKLAGVGKCPEAAIAAAKAKTGKAELASPSCPANSQIGRILAGAGVGSVLTYVKGSIYLAGAYKGAPLSVVVVTPAVAGPFDVGTASDPIPHILEGIPLKLRDLRVYVDRDKFILNPTSCDPSSTKATLFGSFLDVFSPADDVSVSLADRFQAANCLNLGFKPKLKLKLRGGTKRGQFPGLRATLNARPGDANIASAQVTLPRSAFLEQGHLKNICTRVQFRAQNCPKGSIYGKARAITPLLAEPLEGPVILRSSNHKLPDLVIALKGIVDINVVSRIDSHKGGLRSTFESVPDAPITKFVLTMKGGKKGLIVNSRNLCKAKNRAKVAFGAHNGRLAKLRPQLKPQCGKARGRKKR